MDTLRLALAYIRFHAAKSAVLVVTLAAILAVPFGVSRLMAAAEESLLARAEATPFLIGARGSRLDLAMSALYFSDDVPEPTTMAAADSVWNSDLAAAIPLHLGFTARGLPIVGTTLDYFDFRSLGVAEGRSLALLGEAVLGADAAQRLGLGPGSRLVSSPDNLFDLSGAYPLAMTVVGVLAPNSTADDRAVFVDVKTAWVIAGVGHGHDDVVPAEAERTADVSLLADPAIVEFTEITPENIDSFHFHGEPGSFPISAVIALPYDARAGAILQGRYLEPDRNDQIAVPREVIAGLLAQLFRIKSLIDAVVVTVGAAALLAVGLAIYLSLQLRRPEMVTAFKLGGRRALIARLVAVESGLLLGAAIALAAMMALGFEYIAADAAVWLIAQAAA